MIALALVLLIGIGAQWLAWRLRLPAIVLLLATGFLVGPLASAVTPGLFGRVIALRPQELISNDVLMPLVSLAVGLILFEGGLSLTFRDIAGVRRVVWMSVTAGAIVTWIVASLAAKYILGLDTGLAVLLGAVLIVTGPTVIGPLLRDVRPTGKVGSVLRWEGIVIDPIGAMITVLVYEAISAGHSLAPNRDVFPALWDMAWGALITVACGTGVGMATAYLLLVLLARYWVPDALRVAFTLMAVVVAFAVTNALVHDSGLFAVTVMGIVLANQRRAQVDQIVEFMESLGVLLLSILFIVLAASIEPHTLGMIGPAAVAFVAVLILIARPLSVGVSTAGSSLSRGERLFMAWMAPRGIVAASVASVFSLRLVAQGIPDAELLTPYVFLVIVGTVCVYGLTAKRVARRLKLSKGTNTGFVIVGATPLAREIAQALAAEKIEVLLVDTNPQNVSAARLAGLTAILGNALSAKLDEHLELSDLGRLLALTGSDEVNTLACVHYAKYFGRSMVYQLPLTVGHENAEHRHALHHELVGRPLFARGATAAKLSTEQAAGAKLKKTHFTAAFGFAQFQERYGTTATPLFLILGSGELTPITADKPVTPQPGETLVSWVLDTGHPPAEVAEAAGDRLAVAAAV